MHNTAYILAAAENLVEILFGVVFFLIWIASAAMNTLSKQREKQRRERVRQEIEMGRTMPPPQMPAPQKRPQPIQRPPPARSVPKRVPVQRPIAVSRPPQQRRPAPVQQVFQQVAPPIPVTSAVRIEEIAARPSAQPQRSTSSATAQTLNAWLRPQTLQRQFILTELLQPPLALRDPDANRII